MDLKSSTQTMSPNHSHTSFPIIAVAIIGIFATILLLVFYYVFVIKCCLNRSRIHRFFSFSRNINHDHSLTSTEVKGLHESVIRSIPIFRFQIQKDSDNDTRECAVCLAEFLQDEKLRMIPNCAHVFHIDCIDVWLQNNANCPLCRNSISMSTTSHFSVPDNPLFIPSLPLNEEDYVVIELGNVNGNGGDEITNSGQSTAKKSAKKLRKKYSYVSSMGDECIDVNTRREGDDQFSIQPIRRSFSMDSASDRQLYLAIQEIIQKNKKNEVCDGCTSSSKRPFFSIGHARSAILPLQIKPQP